MGKRRKRRRFASRRALGWTVLVVLVCLGVVVFRALSPATYEPVVRDLLGRYCRAPVDFDRLNVSFARGVEVDGLRIAEARSDRSDRDTALRLRSVRVVPRLGSLLRGGFDIEEVVLVEPELRVVRRADGTWNLQDLLPEEWAASAPKTTGPSTEEPAANDRPTDAPVADREGDTGAELPSLPAIRIHAGLVEYEGPDGETAELTDVYARLQPLGDGVFAVQTELRSEGARRVRATGELRLPRSGGKPSAQFSINLAKLDLSLPLKRLLPAAARQRLAGLDVRGVADLNGEFHYDADRGLVPTRLYGRVLRCDIDHGSMPYAVQNLSGPFSASGGLVKLGRFTGTLGGGPLSASGSIEFDPTSWSLSGWNLHVEADSVMVDGRVRAVLSTDGQAAFDQYKPRGRVALVFDVPHSTSFPPALEDVKGRIRFLSFGATYRLFPYAVDGLQGEMSLERGWLRFTEPLRARSGPSSIEIAGAGVELKRDGVVDVVIKAYGVPGDERLRASLPVSSRPIWDDFRAQGSGDGVVEIRRAARPDGVPEPEVQRTPRVVVTVFPRNVRIAYRHFPYRIESLTGRIGLDFGTHTMSFVDLRGEHGDHIITGEGGVDLETGVFRLDLHTDELTVDEDLRAAFSESGRQLLDEFQFDGRVAVDVGVQTVETGEVHVTTEVGLIDGVVQHKMFPYRFELASGHLSVGGDQTLRFRDVQTAEGFEPKVKFDGELTTVGQRRTLGFRIDLDSFQFDERLLAALPEKLARFVQRMGMAGLYSGRLKGNFEFDEEDPDYMKLTYSGEDIVAKDAEVNFGLKIGSIAAGGAFVGTKLPDRPHYLVGVVDVASAWFNRLQLKDLSIDFILGEEHEAVAAARQGRLLAGRNYKPPPEIVERLRPDRVDETFQALLHSDDLYGGVVDGFLFVDSGSKGDVGGDFVASGLQVARAADDVFGAGGAGTKGEAEGWVKFGGKAGEVQSIRGRGHGRIVRARLVQLPLFLGLIGVIFGDSSEGHFFRGVSLDYEIRDGRFDAGSGGIEIDSAGIKLFGGGTLDFDGELDLALQPRLLGFKIPVVETILSFVKKGVAEIWVTGDLKAPKVQFVSAAGAVRIGIGADGKEGEGSERLPSDLRRGAEREGGGSSAGN